MVTPRLPIGGNNSDENNIQNFMTIAFSWHTKYLQALLQVIEMSKIYFRFVRICHFLHQVKISMNPRSFPVEDGFRGGNAKS